MKIKDIIDQFIAGDWGEETCSNETPCAVTCVRGADIIPISEYNFSAIPIRYITQQSYLKKRLQVGDIIIEKSGGSPTQSTGRVSFVSQELLDSAGLVVCSNFCTAFRVKKGWNPLYVYYYFQFIYNLGLFFNFEGKTSGLKNLQLDAAFAAIPIDYVSESTQNKIVAVLQGLEKKIALNRQINQNLEAMAKQLYDYWFVQFDFPNEDGKPYKSSGGAMVWNEKLKRRIPEGWNVMSINEICTSCRGVSYGKDDLLSDSNGVLVLRGNNIENNRIVYDSNVAFVPNDFVSEEQHIKEGDIIMTMSSGSKAHVGKCAMFHKDSEHTFGAFLSKFTPKKELRYMTFLFLTSEYFKSLITAFCNGTGINNLTNQTFDDVLLVLPDKNKTRMFESKVNNLFTMIGNNEENMRKLTKQRDELLPLLMNGQVSVNSDLSHD